MTSTDQLIGELLSKDRLRVDCDSGFVFAPKSNTPNKPLGALTIKGYLRTCINYGGRRVYLMLHRVVWIAAHGIPLDIQLQIDHLNGDKAANRLSNLQLVEGIVNMGRAAQRGAFRSNGSFNKINANRDSRG